MKHVACLFALSLVLCGCATDPYPAGSFLPGRIVSLADGKILPAQAEISSGSGKLTATDPVTGEVFDGRYTAIQETTTSQVTRPGFLFDDETGQEVKTSDVAQASAILVGNKGTVINIKMTVKAGSPPIAYGEGTDNKGNKYNVQF